MDTTSYIDLIKTVSKENDFSTTSGEKHFQIYNEKFHSVSFQIKLNDSDYLQVHMWEEDEEKYGRCVYSLRNINDVIRFCNLLITSSDIRAARS